jgi:hypothetical protein
MDQFFNSRSARTASPDLVATPDDRFPHNGTQFRKSQLDVIWNLFGIASGLLPAPPIEFFIHEMVENRNAIAHGRSTAEDVGRNHSKAGILDKIADCRSLCFHIVSELETKCSAAANLGR